MRYRTGHYLTRAPFKYNFEFGNYNTGDQNIVWLDGAEVAVHWSDIQPNGPTDMKLDSLYNLANPWINAGKKVVVRFHTAQLINGGNSNFISTPNWVFNPPYNGLYVWDGSLTQTSQNQAPLRWYPGFLSAYQNFINLLAQQLDNAPWLYAIEMGIGSNGESQCGSGLNSANELTLWTNGPFYTGTQSGQGTGTSVSPGNVTPWSNALWWSTVTTIIGYYVAAFKRTPLFAMINNSSFSPVVGTYDITGMCNTVFSNYPNVFGQNNGLINTQKITNAYYQFAQRAQEPLGSGQDLLGNVERGLLHGNQILYWFPSDIITDAGNGYPILQYAASWKGH